MKTLKGNEDIFDLLQYVEEKNMGITKVFEDEDSYLDREISLVWALIEKQYGIEPWSDTVGLALSDFGEKKMTRQKLMKILEKNKTR